MSCLRSIFSTKESAQQHLVHALASNVCKLDLGYKSLEVIEPNILKCPLSYLSDDDNICLCDFEASSLPELQQHVMVHLKEHVDLKNHVLVFSETRDLDLAQSSRNTRRGLV